MPREFKLPLYRHLHQYREATVARIGGSQTILLTLECKVNCDTCNSFEWNRYRLEADLVYIRIGSDICSVSRRKLRHFSRLFANNEKKTKHFVRYKHERNPNPNLAVYLQKLFRMKYVHTYDKTTNIEKFLRLFNICFKTSRVPHRENDDIIILDDWYNFCHLSSFQLPPTWIEAEPGWRKKLKLYRVHKKKKGEFSLRSGVLAVKLHRHLLMKHSRFFKVLLQETPDCNVYKLDSKFATYLPHIQALIYLGVCYACDEEAKFNHSDFRILLSMLQIDVTFGSVPPGL